MGRESQWPKAEIHDANGNTVFQEGRIINSLMQGKTSSIDLKELEDADIRHVLTKLPAERD